MTDATRVRDTYSSLVTPASMYFQDLKACWPASNCIGRRGAGRSWIAALKCRSCDLAKGPSECRKPAGSTAHFWPTARMISTSAMLTPVASCGSLAWRCIAQAETNSGDGIWLVFVQVSSITLQETSHRVVRPCLRSLPISSLADLTHMLTCTVHMVRVQVGSQVRYL